MILSMTGFGKSAEQVQQLKITAEVKSLNSKQLDVSTRLPQCFREQDLELRKMIAQRLLRGKVDLTVTCESETATGNTTINIPMLEAYKRQIEEASATLGIATPDDWYATLLRLPDVLVANIANTPDEAETLALCRAVDAALQRLIEFRTQEGARLEKFFEEKIHAIEQLLGEVPQYEQARVEKIKARITDGLAKLENVDVDHNRLEQELIFYIEKLDITEEKTRLQNHLTYFLDTMRNESGQGKKLGFIAQEMGREINTLGSKANQAELQKIVVRMKDHLEQIKEQVLNVL